MVRERSRHEIGRGGNRLNITRPQYKQQHRHVRRTRSVDEDKPDETKTDIWTTTYDKQTSGDSDIEEVFYSD